MDQLFSIMIDIWLFFRFTDEDIYFTGLLTEPGSRSMSVSIWGFGAVDRVWRVHTIDFTKVIKDQCKFDSVMLISS